MATELFKKNQEYLKMEDNPNKADPMFERDAKVRVKHFLSENTPMMDDSMDDPKYYVSLTFENMSAEDIGCLLKNINEFSQMSHISVNQM